MLNAKLSQIIFIIMFVYFSLCSVGFLKAGSISDKQDSFPKTNVVTDKLPSNEEIYKFEDTKPMPQPNLKALVFKVFFILTLIVICIVAVSISLGFFFNYKKNLFAKKERYLELIDRMALDSKKSICLIKVIDEVLIVGSGSDGLNLLGKITDKDKVDAISSREFMPLLDLFNKKMDTLKGDKNG